MLEREKRRANLTMERLYIGAKLFFVALRRVSAIFPSRDLRAPPGASSNAEACCCGGVAHAESRRMAGRSTGLLGRSCHSAAVHPSSLSFSALPPSSFSCLSRLRPIPAIVAVSTRRRDRVHTRPPRGGKTNVPFLDTRENWTDRDPDRWLKKKKKGT